MYARKNPHLRHLVIAAGGNQRMFGLSVGNVKTRMGASTAVGLLVLIVTGLFLLLSFRGRTPEVARDYEECVEALPVGLLSASGSSTDAQRSSVTDCNARFAGRRKPGGGYVYYDFMQDRRFDIAGPNPTAEERKRIDREYVRFLDVQRQERVSAELAKGQDEELQLDLERAHQPVGRPLILTPKNLPAQTAKRSPDRTRSPRCEDNSLACGWSRLSAAVKGVIASSSNTKP
jgi:hypothetical protein